MSHVGNGENDFDDLKGPHPIWTEEDIERIKLVRIEARDIIDRLEPLHISSWADLFAKLEDSLETAKRNARIIDPVFRQRWEQHQREMILKKLQIREKYIRRLVIGCILMVSLILVDYFTNLSSKTGQFIFWVVLPVLIGTFCFGWVLFPQIGKTSCK